MDYAALHVVYESGFGRFFEGNGGVRWVRIKEWLGFFGKLNLRKAGFYSAVMSYHSIGSAYIAAAVTEEMLVRYCVYILSFRIGSDKTLTSVV